MDNDATKEDDIKFDDYISLLYENQIMSKNKKIFKIFMIILKVHLCTKCPELY